MNILLEIIVITSYDSAVNYPGEHYAYTWTIKVNVYLQLECHFISLGILAETVTKVFKSNLFYNTFNQMYFHKTFPFRYIARQAHLKALIQFLSKDNKDSHKLWMQPAFRYIFVFLLYFYSVFPFGVQYNINCLFHDY